jgi:hypothetical protein
MDVLDQTNQPYWQIPNFMSWYDNYMIIGQNTYKIYMLWVSFHIG